MTPDETRQDLAYRIAARIAGALDDQDCLGDDASFDSVEITDRLNLIAIAEKLIGRRG